MYKIYECNICQEQFVMGKNTDKKAFRQEVTNHVMHHYGMGCDARDCFVVAVNYRADYVCTCCGGVFREGKRLDLARRMFEHAQVCRHPIIPREFLTDEENTALARS